MIDKKTLLNKLKIYLHTRFSRLVNRGNFESTIMKPLILLVVLCSLFICTLNAAPVRVPNLGLPETFEKQQLESNYMERLPDFYSQIQPMILLAAGNRAGNRHGSIQAANELGRMLLNFASSFPSASSKNGDLSDEEKGQTFRDGYSSALSSIRKQLANWGEIQSDDVEIMQIFANLFGSPHSGITKKTKNGEILSQSAGDKEIERKLLNDARIFFAAVSKIDPDNEVIQTLVNGANTLLSFAGRRIENGGDVHVQSSDVNGEVKQAFMNLAISLLSMTWKTINDTYGAKIQGEELEFHRTMLNIMKFLFPVMYRNAISRAGPNNEMLSKIHEWFGTMLPIMADLEVGRRDNEKVRNGMRKFISLLSMLTKKFENSKFRDLSTSKFAPLGRILWNFMNSMFHNISKGIEPEDYMPPGFIDQFNQGFNTFLSILGKSIGIDNDRESEIQSDKYYTNREFLKTVLNLMQDINSDHQKKAKPKELEFAQPFFTVIDKMLSTVKDIYGFGGAQTVYVDTLPTDHVDQRISVESWDRNVAADRFDQKVSVESWDQNAAANRFDHDQKVSVESGDRKGAVVMEVDDDGDMGLPEEARVQLWRALLRHGLASGLLNKKYLS